MSVKNIKRQKMLIIHPVLATYRIDQFNLLNKMFDLEIVFLFDQMWNFKMNQNKIIEQCNFKSSYLLTGPRIKGRVFRFGILSKIRKHKPDIIIGYEYSFTTQYLILLKSLGLISQKIGSFIDDSLEICHKVQSKTRRVARNNSIHNLDFLIVMSKEVASFYKTKFKLDDNNIIVSPILQLSQRLRKESNEIEQIANKYLIKYNLNGKKVLLFIGRFISEKGLDLFINNISSMFTENEEFVFILIGDGPEINSLKAIVKHFNLEDKIFFPGKYQFEELYAWYACASGFVLPSKYEPFGAVVNEALIFGLPVMCSQFAGSASLVNKNNGVVFNPHDREETLVILDEFIQSINPVWKISLSKTPPLINDHKVEFKKEWRKIAYE